MTEKYSSDGDHNLEVLEKSTNFTDWMYEQVKPYFKGNILEVGSGIGTYSSKVLRSFPKRKVVLSDFDGAYVKKLKKRYKGKKNVEVVQLDLTKKKDFASIKTKFDCAFALNVFEHIENDVLAMKNIYDNLQPGGRLIILVPAHMWLYNCIDKAIDHFRRYNRKMMKGKVAKTKFKIVDMFYFNFVSIAGWYWNGNIKKQVQIDEGAMGFFNKLVPFLRPIEKYILRRSMGISLVTVLEKEK